METLCAAGDHLREWRRHRRVSQLALASDADISPKHLCFLETGRSQRSREMLPHLAERLQIPLRERNVLLRVANEPYPAFAVDRHWALVASNGAFTPFLSGIEPGLLRTPVDVLRLTLHPGGLAPRLAYYQEWRSIGHISASSSHFSFLRRRASFRSLAPPRSSERPSM
jgi:transcriptional regulator with XRE-family HTH domain